MKTEWIFPVVLILCNAGAMAVYFSKGQNLRGWYWLAALQLNVCVFLMARGK